MSQLADPLTAGREAAERRAWPEAFEHLSEADRSQELSGQDLELLAEAAIWNANFKESIAATERAFSAYVKEGDRVRAAVLAATLAHHYAQLTQKARAQGWLGQAERLLDQEQEDTIGHGWLAVHKALFARSKGDLDGMLQLGREAERIGRALGDRNVEIIGIQRQGMALVDKGQVDEGLALLDLASTAAAAGELDPFETVVVYCNTIGACRERGDYGRAFEWADIANEWCDDQGATKGFPGICRVNRAEVLRHRGAFEEAEQEARHAAEDLKGFSPRIEGEAFYEIGEINVRVGRLDAAAKAFDQAHELGREPEPGLSLLRLAEGKVDAASRSIRNALSDDSLLPLSRARMLPAEVEIALAAGEVERARAARDELAEIAALHGTEALSARAAQARGAVAIADGDVESALRCLRQAFRLWNDEVHAPYDAARTRVLLGQAHRLGGDADAGERELRAARKTFEDLGATLDAERTAELLGVDTGKRLTRTFMFTDIVDSTRWAGQVSEDKWRTQLSRHNDIVGAAISDGGGEVVKTIGDGFFAAFDNPVGAVESAVAIQRMITSSGLPFDVRIGLHTADATSRDGDYEGRGVHAAARVGALASAGEIVASAGTIAKGLRFPVSEPRDVALKGFEGEAQVVSIDWRLT
jgi:class 3 adenylate cyclase